MLCHGVCHYAFEHDVYHIRIALYCGKGVISDESVMSIRRSHPGGWCWRQCSVTGPGSWWGWVFLLSASSAWWWGSSFYQGQCEAPGVCPCNYHQSGLPTLPGNHMPASTWPKMREDVKEMKRMAVFLFFQLLDIDAYIHNTVSDIQYLPASLLKCNTLTRSHTKKNVFSLYFIWIE